MKKWILACLFMTSLTAFAEEIVIYGPGSSKWIQKHYAPIFEKKTGHIIKYVAIDGLVQRLTLERAKPKADIVVGLTPVDIEVAKKNKVLTKYKPKNIGNIKKEVKYSKEYFAIPYDYGMLAINYDKTKIKNPPKTLAELSNLKKQLLIENPNTSTTGAEALQWSIALYGKDWKKFWNTIKPAIYNVEPGWDEAFAKFLAGEVPMMLGYATSDIFFVQDETQKDKFASFLLEDGNYMFTESAALVGKKEIKAGAKAFMEEILSEDFQKMTAAKNYMFPVTSISLAKEFDVVPKTEKKVQVILDREMVENIQQYKQEVVEILKK